MCASGYSKTMATGMPFDLSGNPKDSWGGRLGGGTPVGIIPLGSEKLRLT
jgi:hypothetical protein